MSSKASGQLRGAVTQLTGCHLHKCHCPLRSVHDIGTHQSKILDCITYMSVNRGACKYMKWKSESIFVIPSSMSKVSIFMESAGDIIIVFVIMQGW